MELLCIQSWNGVRNYYGTLLPQEFLIELDNSLYERIKVIVKDNYKQISNRNVLSRILTDIQFLSNEFQLHRKRISQDFTEIYDTQKGLTKGKITKEQNKKIIEQRKKEYRKRETEGREL